MLYIFCVMNRICWIFYIRVDSASVHHLTVFSLISGHYSTKICTYYYDVFSQLFLDN